MNAELASPVQNDLHAAARRLAAGLWGGLICGLLIGGVGGRLAMFILRLTSDSALRGVETDDGFIIGKFTTDTIGFVAFMAGVGAIGGIFYLGVRNWIPDKRRAPAMALLAGLGGGAIVIRPDGIDFTLLEPLWLAVAMFIALPALYGVATVALVERFLVRAEPGDSERGWLVTALLLAPLAAGGPVGLVLVLLSLVVWNVSRTATQTSVWKAPAFGWTGRVLLTALGAYSLVLLVKDVSEVL